MKDKKFNKLVGAGISIGVLIIVILAGYSVLMDETDCMKQIAEKYPNISCVSAEYICCEWKGEMYKVVRKSWEEGKGYNCDLEKIEDNPESINNTDSMTERYFIQKNTCRKDFFHGEIDIDCKETISILEINDSRITYTIEDGSCYTNDLDKIVTFCNPTNEDITIYVKYKFVPNPNENDFTYFPNESYFGNVTIEYIEPETTMTIYSNNSEEFWDAKEYIIEYNCDNPQNLTIWLKLDNETYNIQEFCRGGKK